MIMIFHEILYYLKEFVEMLKVLKATLGACGLML